MVVLCFSYYGESMDIKFLIVVTVAMKLVKIKINLSGTRFGERDDLCLYTEMGIESITGVYHVKAQC